MLQAQMKVGHQSLFCGDGFNEVFVSLNAVNAANAQPWQIWHKAENAHHQISKSGSPRQICPPRCEINTCQNHFVKSPHHEAFNLFHDNTCRNGARITPPKRNDAKGAAMIASVLHLHISTAAGAKSVNQMACGFLDRHDIVNLNLFMRANKIGG